MAIQYCGSLFCGRPFQVNEFSQSFGKHSSVGKIVCPHCGLVSLSIKTKVFITHALAPEEELALKRIPATTTRKAGKQARQKAPMSS